MLFVYRLGVAVIGTATFLTSAFVITMVAFTLTDAPTGEMGGDILIAVPSAALITSFVVNVWRWVCCRVSYFYKRT